jgi:hypothetical protein
LFYKYFAALPLGALMTRYHNAAQTATTEPSHPGAAHHNICSSRSEIGPQGAAHRNIALINNQPIRVQYHGALHLPFLLAWSFYKYFAALPLGA